MEVTMNAGAKSKKAKKSYKCDIVDAITLLISLIGFWQKLRRLTDLRKGCVTSTESTNTTRPTKRKARITNQNLKENFYDENQNFNYVD